MKHFKKNISIYCIPFFQICAAGLPYVSEAEALPPHLASADTLASVQRIRNIVSVETVNVDCPVGTVPCLPYRVWVNYSDGTGEYRQTRWMNSSLAVEQAQADSGKYPVGTRYTVDGFITGDETTSGGFPIKASVSVVDRACAVPSNVPVADVLPLDRVTITGNNRLTSNRELAIRQILSWDVNQQLYNYCDTYGLSTEGYPESDGWDSPTTKLKGHGSGHYMSALAFAFASATQKEQKDSLRQRIRRMVDGLRECQERTFVWNDSLGRYWEARDFAPEEELVQMEGTWDAFEVYKKQYARYGYGYINAIPAQHVALIEKYAAYNNTSGVWAPYYSIHKQLAGLIDIATYVDDKKIAAKALLIAKDMGLWIWNRLHYRTYVKMDGTQEERRRRPGNRYEMWNMYIAGEVGGVGESLARLSEMVSDADDKARLLEASNYFDSPALYNPLSRNIDDIRTRHANQHIPMIVSALRSYRGNGEPYYYNIAQNFWNLIQGRYRYATGGVGNGEMFRQPYTQILSMATNVTSDGERNLHPSPTLNETCCAYNLAKLTKDLNCFNPNDAHYMDYYERVLSNQIVGSLNPKHYQTTYHYAVGLDASKPWGNETPQSSCCGGTGSENHVKYQEAAYFVSADTMWVALYMPTVAHWDEKGITLRQDCLWPAERSVIRVDKGRSRFTLKLRVPYWATEGFDIRLNGESVAESYRPGSYITVCERRWKKSDSLEVIMPFTKHVDFGPDKMETAATGINQTKTPFEPMWAGTLMYGPLAMAATGVIAWSAEGADIPADMSTVESSVSYPKSASDAVLYTLKWNGLTFVPDYYADKHSTHYFRMHLLGDPSAEVKSSLADIMQDASAFLPSHYTSASYTPLKTALYNAGKLCSSASVSQKQADDAEAAIKSAMRALVPTGLDKSALSTAVSEASACDSTLYTTASFDWLRSSLAHAKAVLVGTSAVQADVDMASAMVAKALRELERADAVNKSALIEVMQTARQRIDAQNAWNALAVKVPEYAPWAPHAYGRMKEQYAKALDVSEGRGRIYSQEEVQATAAGLNAALTTMRPGNLPELEDMDELLPLLERAKNSSSASDMRETIEYAEMVVKYVSDGSGTHDMIVNACDKLKTALAGKK